MPEKTARLAEVRARLVQWLRGAAEGLPGADPEDIAQDAFAALFGSDAAAAVEDLSAWLFRAARNRRTDLIRRKRETTELDRPDEDGATTDLPDARASAHDVMERAEWRAALYASLAELDDVDQALVRGVDLEGRTHEELARELGMPVGTALSRKHRALAKLRAAMEARGVAPP